MNYMVEHHFNHVANQSINGDIVYNTQVPYEFQLKRTKYEWQTYVYVIFWKRGGVFDKTLKH